MARRSLISPYFSQESIRRAEPMVQNLCSKFLSILQVATSKEKGEVVNLSRGFRALTLDTIMTFTFNKPLGALDSPGFDFSVTKALTDGAVVGQWSVYFPSSFKLLLQAIDMLPFWLIEKYMPPFAYTKLLLRVGSLRSILLSSTVMTLRITGLTRTHFGIRFPPYNIVGWPPHHIRHCI